MIMVFVGIFCVPTHLVVEMGAWETFVVAFEVERMVVALALALVHSNWDHACVAVALAV